jgi:hypothetical protein
MYAGSMLWNLMTKNLNIMCYLVCARAIVVRCIKRLKMPTMPGSYIVVYSISDACDIHKIVKLYGKKNA